MTKADFYYAELQDAVLADATPRRRCVVHGGSDRHGPDGGRGRGERALFREPLPFEGPLDPSLKVIECVADLVRVCLELGRGSDGPRGYSLYYRGQEKGWELRPSVVRRRLLRESEGRMLLDMMTRRPEDFSGMVFGARPMGSRTAPMGSRPGSSM